MIFSKALLFAVLLLVYASIVAAEPPPADVIKIDLLPPGPENPRNSEGDFVTLDDGSVLFVYTHFTGGASDHASAHLASRVSDDGGRTWSRHDQLVIKNESEQNIMSVSLLRLRDGRIALFYLEKESNVDCRPVVRFSHDEARTWSEPRAVVPDEDIGYYVLNNDRVLLMDDGRLIAPLAEHYRNGDEKWDPNARMLCYVSDDAAKTWQRGEVAPMPEDAPVSLVLQEPGVVETGDDQLLMYCRTNAGAQYGAISKDRGLTWTAMRPLPLPSPRSPATLERIPGTKRILAVWNDHQDIPAKERKLRTPLTLALASDPTETWDRVMTLEDNPHGWFCYTALHFLDDAVLLGYCAGDRRENNGLAFTRIARIPLATVQVAD